MEKTDFDVEKAETAIVVVDKLEEISTNSRERHNTISKSLQEIIINLIDEGTFTINTINVQIKSTIINSRTEITVMCNNCSHIFPDRLRTLLSKSKCPSCKEKFLK